MKGIIYTVLLEMTEMKFGYQTADKIIIQSELVSKGIYTSVGSYSNEELFVLINSLTEEVHISKRELMILLGEHLYRTFVENYNSKLLLLESSISFLERFENYINLEIVRILEKEKAPEILINYVSKHKLIMTYHVESEISELIEGLILGALNICNENVEVQKTRLSTANRIAYNFILTKR